MKITFTEVGRDKRTWTKELKGAVSESQIAKEAKRGGRLMSSGVDAEINERGDGGKIIVGGWRCVGKFTISNK